MTIRGEAGHFKEQIAVPVEPYQRGTVFVCDIDDNEACITLGPLAGEGTGVVMEHFAMQWGGTGDAPSGAIGLYVRNLRGVVVRHAFWDRMPGSSLQANQTHEGLFDDLTFSPAPDGESTNMVHLKGESSDLHLRRIGHQGGFDYAFHLLGVDGITLESLTTHRADVSNVLIADSGRVVIRGSRFEVDGAYAEQQGTGGVIHVTRSTTTADSLVPDLVVTDNYFDGGCVGIDSSDKLVVVRIDDFGSIDGDHAPAAPRVFLRGNVYRDFVDAIIYDANDDSDWETAWQCSDEHLSIQVGTGGVTRLSYDLRAVSEESGVYTIDAESCGRYRESDFPSVPGCGAVAATQ